MIPGQYEDWLDLYLKKHRNPNSKFSLIDAWILFWCCVGVLQFAAMAVGFVWALISLIL